MELVYHSITGAGLAVRAACAPRCMRCLPSNPRYFWMETNRCYLRQVKWLEAPCGNSYFIERFLAVVCG